jgi:hypothetical protein
MIGCRHMCRQGAVTRLRLHGNTSGPAAAAHGSVRALGVGRRGGSGVVHKLRPAQQPCNTQTYLRKKWTSQSKRSVQLRK